MGLTETLADYFDLDSHDTTVRTELLAGLTTFLTMSYIVVVNPAILAAAIDIEGVGQGRLVAMLAVVTIISAATATLVMALYANRPFAQAPGLGLNAFFAFTVVLGMGVPWQTALAAVVVEGIIFIALTAVGAREYVIRLFPEPVKLAVGSGIGLFLALIGFESMRVVASDPATFLTLSPVVANDPVALISVAGLLFTFGLYARGIRGSIVIGILGTTVAGYVAAALGYTAYNPENVPGGAAIATNIFLTGSTTTYSLAAYDIRPLAGAFLEGFANVDAFTFALIVFTFFFVDFFDTAGTLVGVGQSAGFLDDEGNLPDIDKPLMADAVGTTVGGMLGTSTVTTYIESATGVEEGGRTGLTALTVAGLFLLSLLFVPLAAAIPEYASHIALVVIGVVMLGNAVEVAWDDLTYAIPAGMTIMVMPFTFSIAYGIAAGIVSYPVVKLAAGELDDIHVGQWILAGAFVVYFAVRTSGVM
ncbi:MULTISPECIES: NCS2 family permease [Halolamina]|uniref:Putative MFS transporter, AGZA family, xanthine/uracil permease n=1 Tax=Halolamina pelagica TaxID=699431 RepID=A0A1I5SGT1_9EURY|nr:MULTISPECIES: NCS2 family permease [Halolamina]NHX37067.1 NCS2 family permease [Halolamina sp. R1-12]SFP69919.1 putative MFS transporter, AGZA family, xanthine/uracil permease [Halolamina pelagica]